MRVVAEGLDGFAADVPDRALRGDRPGVGEHAQDAQLAADARLVEALEAAAGHSRRGAVAEAARAAEAEAGRPTEAGRVRGAHEERAPLEPVGRDELDLRVEVAPVG